MDSEEQNQVMQELPTLNEAQKQSLLKQDLRGLVPPFHQQKLEKEAAKNWDKFYKRNETRFFKDRHWTTREFQELVGGGEVSRVLLEVGCGVGNFIYPLLEDDPNLFVYACDFSSRAVQFVRENPKYDPARVQAFECDIVKEELSSKLDGNEVDIISMIFVLSAIHPDKFKDVIANLYQCLRPGGVVLVRDYGLYDMAMLRFGPGSKLGSQLYVRQDGTRAYYFTKDELGSLFQEARFTVASCHYVARQTVNKKEGVNARRNFIQGKFLKPTD
ncbi:tRNA N(3)-methylcytidine methyltransferase METTL6-like [Scylla paramamosain]|uniref:tRNA N(3)-methylcytidine methyltransferase METTL6-like n=1 Tax=Scylla paramamosain TaxID=85552 RepID=UPI0030834A5E